MSDNLRRNTMTSKETEGSCFPAGGGGQRFLNLQSTNFMAKHWWVWLYQSERRLFSKRYREQVIRQITGQKISAVFRTDQDDWLEYTRTSCNSTKKRKATGKWAETEMYVHDKNMKSCFDSLVTSEMQIQVTAHQSTPITWQQSEWTTASTGGHVEGPSELSGGSLEQSGSQRQEGGGWAPGTEGGGWC